MDYVASHIVSDNVRMLLCVWDPAVYSMVETRCIRTEWDTLTERGW